MSLWPTVYNLVGVPLGRAFSRLAAPFRPKLAEGLAGRARTFGQIESFLAAPPAGKPATGGMLVHATSVGEYLQAVPLLERIRSAEIE